MIYAAPTYALGADEAVQAKVAEKVAKPPTKAEAARELRKMKSELRAWLKFRRVNDELASGKRTSKKVPQAVAIKVVKQRDYSLEQELATQIHNLLSELYDPQSLPVPDVKADPNAAAKLAEIAINGLPEKVAAPGPAAQGFIPLLIIGGVVLFAISTVVSSLAEVAKEKERIKCVQAGGGLACSDTGKLIKIALVAGAMWFAWTRMGIGDRVTGFIKGKA